jgi:hypothetical protein
MAKESCLSLSPNISLTMSTDIYIASEEEILSRRLLRLGFTNMLLETAAVIKFCESQAFNDMSEKKMSLFSAEEYE